MDRTIAGTFARKISDRGVSQRGDRMSLPSGSVAPSRRVRCFRRTELIGISLSAVFKQNRGLHAETRDKRRTTWKKPRRHRGTMELGAVRSSGVGGPGRAFENDSAVGAGTAAEIEELWTILVCRSDFRTLPTVSFLSYL